MKKIFLLTAIFSLTATAQDNQPDQINKKNQINDELAFTYCVYEDKIYSRNATVNMADGKIHYCYKQQQNMKLRWKEVTEGTVIN